MNSVGIVTSRDEFVIDFDKNALKNRIAQLESKTQNDEIIAQAYDLKDKSKLETFDCTKPNSKIR